MALDDQKKWDERYAQGHGIDRPAAFLEHIFLEFSWCIKPGRALDVATGRGRNALFLAQRGFAVEALDVSVTALKEAAKRADELGLNIVFRQADLDHVELPHDAYDLIVNFNFLQRSLIPKIKNAARPGGYVIFETYLIDQRLVGHPRNPSYLLGHNELLELFRDFRILYYREGKFIEAGKEAYRGGLFGQKAP
ncbi:MAG: methyltransferase domain-containing protein [Deltaproteobacteria bacterium]|nr:methyltransferase domain-containing protein [Deltaproteobacteria bacterium]